MAFKIGNIQVFPNSYYFDFMKWRRITIGISIIFVITSLLIIALKGINYGIDFLGGSEIQISVSKDSKLTKENITDYLHKSGFNHFEIATYGNLNNTAPQESYLIRLQRDKGQDQNSTNDKATQIASDLKKQFEGKVQVNSMTNISGKVGKEDEYKGYLALLISCFGILLYIALRFDARFAPGAVLCLVHNVIIALGFMTILDKN